MIDFEGEEEGGGGAGWLATFADLMSLLMCFFVLLLSFSEMDLAKYKQVAGSMKDAFGVQNEVRAKDIPKGTSIIAQEFSPGRPDSTILNIVRQQTIQANLNTLDVRDRAEGSTLEENETGYYVEDVGEGTSGITEGEAASIVAEQLEQLVEQTRIDAQKLIEELEEEIQTGMIDIEAEDRAITIRIRERGSFPSASAGLQPEFVPVLAKIRKVLEGIEGQIAVEGHTDSVPISTPQYSSNWSLSASRALSVVEELRKFNDLEENRFIVIGHADTVPFAPDNSTEEYRALNRRVEIVIRQPVKDTLSASATELEEPALEQAQNAEQDVQESEAEEPEAPQAEESTTEEPGNEESGNEEPEPEGQITENEGLNA